MSRCFVQIPGGRIKPYSNSFNGHRWRLDKGWEPTTIELRQRIVGREVPVELKHEVDDLEPANQVACVSCGREFDPIEQWAAAPDHLFVVVDDEDWEQLERLLAEDNDSSEFNDEVRVCTADGCDECPQGCGYLDHGVCGDCGYNRNTPKDMAECALLQRREIASVHSRCRQRCK